MTTASKPEPPPPPADERDRARCCGSRLLFYGACCERSRLSLAPEHLECRPVPRSMCLLLASRIYRQFSRVYIVSVCTNTETVH